jgi:hypothetical protein
MAFLHWSIGDAAWGLLRLRRPECGPSDRRRSVEAIFALNRLAQFVASLSCMSAR